MTTETETAFTELLDEVAATHAPHGRAAGRRRARHLLEAHKWVLSILQVAAEVNLWADTARPRFVEIVGPYKKWGGDNADAFYCYAPIDPARTYRVTARARRRRLHVADRLRRSRRRALLRPASSAAVNSHDATRDADGAIHIVLSPDRARRSPASPGSAWSPTPWPPSPGTTSRTR